MNYRTARPHLLLLLLAATLLLAGCGASDETGSGEASGETAAPQRQFLSIGTAPTGGAFFVVGGALVEVANQFSGDSGWQVTAEATQGSQENIRRLESGDLDFALSNAAISYFAVRGQASWDQSYDLRTVMTLAPNVALFVTPADSGVERIADLAGKRAVVGPAGAGFEMFVAPLMAAHGVTYEDFEPLHATQAGAVDLLADDNAVAAFLGGAVPTTSIIQASTSMDLRFLPYEDEPKTNLLNDYPFFSPATIPAGTYRGQGEDYHGLNVGSMQLITSAKVSDDLVYNMTKTLYENRTKVVERHPAGKAIQPGNVVRDTGTPFHPGAIRYYQEIGIWPEANAAAETDATADSGDADSGDADSGDASNEDASNEG